MNTSTDQLCNFEAAARIPQPKPQHGEQKRQVRRRRQSRRLYKEMPLNMAEARREIVTALKLHRASTKQQQHKHNQQINQPPVPLFPQLCPCFEPQGRMKSRRKSRIYPSCSYNCSVYLENGSDFSCPIIAPPPPPPVAQNLNTEIPIQTLGLNLNFDDDFKTVDTCSVVCDNSHSFYSLSFLTPSSYICPPVSYAATHQQVPKSISLSEEEEAKLLANSDVFWSNNIPIVETENEIQRAAVDQEAMPKMKPLEIDDDDDHHSFDKPMEFPDWLSINDDFLQQHFNSHCVEDCLQDPDLSCMNIGEIEDVDGDWLA